MKNNNNNNNSEIELPASLLNAIDSTYEKSKTIIGSMPQEALSLLSPKKSNPSTPVKKAIKK